MNTSSSWRTAIDPKTQKLYYWNVQTREARWKKPLELASPSERMEMVRKEEELKCFFREMEDNIKRRMETSYQKNGIMNVIVGGDAATEKNKGSSNGVISTSSKSDNLLPATISPKSTATTTTTTILTEHYQDDEAPYDEILITPNNDYESATTDESNHNNSFLQIQESWVQS